jgi:phosphoglycolate phosphatase-like HAD superfamily hydrolase
MKLILFDIDGTLIWPDGAGRLAMSRALAEVCGASGLADSLPMAGKTDWQIAAELLKAAGLDPAAVEAALPRCFEAVARHMLQTARERHLHPCAGVPQLLARLSAHSQVVLGLLTGNLAMTAPVKLRAAHLDPVLFRVGAYGSDGLHRSQLPAVAIARAEALTGHMFRGKNVVILGDTPADVTCGRHLGVIAVGVATGHHSQEVLSAAGADYVFPDLSDTQAVMQVLALTD